MSSDTSEGRRNVLLGLALLPLGLLGGLALSLFSFVPLVAPPPGFEHYADLPRRVLRLAHIAAVMLPLINVVVGRQLDGLRLSRRLKQTASWLISGAVALPLALTAEAWWLPLAQLHPSGVPAIALVVALTLTAVGALRSLHQPAVSSPRAVDASTAAGLSDDASFANQVFRSSRSL